MKADFTGEVAVDVIELLRSLIRFPSVNPPGQERACMEFVAGLLADHGVESTLYALDPERPNLVARIPGSGAAPPLLLYGHLDVVPVENQSWTVPPFEAVVKDGCIWGRGALDMKGGIAMMLSAFLQCARQTPPGDLILALVSDEEAGGKFGAAYLVAEHAGLFDRVRHAIGEFGAFTLHIAGRRFFPIQIAEKRYCRLDITFGGSGGHASTPPNGTAVTQAARFLTKLDRTRMPIRVSTAARKMIEQLAAGVGSPFARSLLRMLCNARTAPLALHLLGEQRRMFEPLVRTMITPTILQGGTKRNVVPESMRVEFDVRMVPGQGTADIEAHVRRLAGPACRIELEVSETPSSEPDLSQFALLKEIAQQLDAGAVVIPMLLPGVTDSRHFDRLGIQTYGFLPMIFPPGMNFMSMIHGADERIPLDTLAPGRDAIFAFISRYRG